MIVSNDKELNFYINLLKDINKCIVGYNAIIKSDQLSSIFSSSPYIDDIKLDILTIVRNIVNDHAFIDGNKRTALSMLVYLISQYNLRIRKSESYLTELIIKLAYDKIDLELESKLLFTNK